MRYVPTAVAAIGPGSDMLMLVQTEKCMRKPWNYLYIRYVYDMIPYSTFVWCAFID